ncbi:MAG: serine/threonine protein kinase [Polyangiaceae bacterium]|nr:serine/threonine protein kinase [Polyangiaceae bacterium]
MTEGPSDGTPDSTLPATAGAWLEPGTVIARKYRLETPIGAGGFGQVYVATQLDIDRRVALKVLPAAATMSPEHLARFRNEAALVQRLEHPHTVRLYDHGISEEGVPFIAMELLRGESLAACISRVGPQSEERAARVGIQVLKALMEAHGASAIHRDIKPANIFLTAHAGEPLFVKLLDFGIAKELIESAPLSRREALGPSNRIGKDLTSASHVMGTPRYMAPEQVTGSAVGPAADLFSLGLTLSEMLTGRPVVPSEDALEILEARSSGAHIELDPRVRASALGPILERATQADPSRRFSTAEEMLRAMEQLSIKMPFVEALPPRDREIFVTAPTEATPAMSRRHGAPRRLPILPIAIAAVCVAGLLALGAFGLKGSSREREAKSTEREPAAERAPPSKAAASNSAGVTSAQRTAPSELRTLVAPYPDRAFEKDPRRQASLAHLGRSELRGRVERAGYTVTIEKALGEEGIFVDAKKGSCMLTISWFEMKGTEAAVARAKLMAEGTSGRWPVVSSGKRVLSIGGGDSNEAASNACVEPLLEALLKPAPVGK